MVYVTRSPLNACYQADINRQSASVKNAKNHRTGLAEWMEHWAHDQVVGGSVTTRVSQSKNSQKKGMNHTLLLAWTIKGMFLWPSHAFRLHIFDRPVKQLSDLCTASRAGSQFLTERSFKVKGFCFRCFTYGQLVTPSSQPAWDVDADQNSFSFEVLALTVQAGAISNLISN